jgi:hypothetical protein
MRISSVSIELDGSQGPDSMMIRLASLVRDSGSAHCSSGQANF